MSTQDKYKQVVLLNHIMCMRSGLLRCYNVIARVLAALVIPVYSFCLDWRQEWELPDWTSSYPAVLVDAQASFQPISLME